MLRSYLIIVIIFPLLLTAIYHQAFIYLEGQGYQMRQIPFQILYDYQTNKAQSSQAELIFVGDSSLGNAINAELFSQISNLNAESYALTGTFGYVGTLDIIKKVKSPNLRTIVIMHTPDMMMREIAQSYSPQKLFSSSFFDGVDSSIINLMSFYDFLGALEDFVKGKKKGNDYLQNDYIRQVGPIDQSENFDPLPVERINNEKINKLFEIQQYCVKQDLNCLYIHGPVIEDICKTSDGYFKTVNKMILETGIKMSHTKPVCIPRSKIGDSIDHVHPDYKDEYTRIYFEIIF